MQIETWILYVTTVLAFMSTPGPSHILMLSNSLGSGFQRARMTAAGDLSANFIQMTAAAIGLASIITQFSAFFVIVKWAGVSYLLYLGIRLILSKPADQGLQQAAPRSRSSLYWQGFITSMSNPKAVIFFAALFPQFLDSSQPLLMQFVALSLTYLVVDGLFLCFYGKFAEVIAGRYLKPFAHRFNQVAGSLYIGAAILLGLKSVER
ncbi:MAG: LysE family translocator [Pseudomonadota bacterium]